MKRLPVISTLLSVAMLVVAAIPVGSALALADVAGPLTSAVVVSPDPVTLNGTATVTATVDDTATGGSNIQSAEFSLNGDAWTALSASDGAFDSPTEDVTGTFTATQQGDNEICVRGTDAAGNVGDSACANFAVESVYTFKGFFPPVRMDRANVAKAGRTVPLKWNLTLSDGSPVSDPAAIVGIFSYSVDCTTLVGDPSTAVPENGPGQAGLRYQKRGNWIFNWKVPRTYAGACRAIFLQLSDGSMSPIAIYRFR